MSASDVIVQLACDGAGLPSAADMGSWVEFTLATAAAHERRAREVTVRVVDEDEARAYNRRYRERDRASNVLSFPAAAAAEFAALDAAESLPLGDIVLCAPLVEREAAEQGKNAAHHWAHLLVHGTLHLLGYDHQGEREARAMEALEARILAARGIGDPYRERETA